MNFNKHYKIDLADRRKELHLTQVGIAKKCGVSKSAIQRWEHRKANITVENLKEYARVLKLNPLDIIDPEHEFKHYEDMEDYDLEGIDSIHEIRNLCLRLTTTRIAQVHNFSKKMLDEQNDMDVNFKNLTNQIKHYDLEVQLIVHDDSSVEEIPEIDRKKESFDGQVPRDYTICTKFKTDKIMTFTYNQIVFLKKATIDGMYSGVNVVVSNKDGNMYIRKFRSFNKTLYLIPLTSQSSQKSEEELGKEEDKFIWSSSDDWIRAEYLINQPSY